MHATEAPLVLNVKLALPLPVLAVLHDCVWVCLLERRRTATMVQLPETRPVAR